MHISLNNIGKRFNREWIFRHLDAAFVSGEKYAITGANGSGKSTLLQVIAGALTFSEGSISFTPSNGQQPIDPDHFFKQVSIAAPYLDLVEELTAAEFLAFHQQFKPFTLTTSAVLKTVQLEKAAGKQIRYFSSGMKQRLKLAQAFCSNTPVLLLDEPTTNLDAEGIALYHELIRTYAADRTLLISSNDPEEYACCSHTINIHDYKQPDMV